MKNQVNNRLVKKLKFISKICAIFVFFIGFFATIGWQFDISSFKRVLASLPVIAPNTAISFMVLALLILMSSSKKPRPFAKHVVLFFAGLVSLLGFLTLLEYLTNFSFGIDQIFFAQKMGEGIVRMSPQSALNFFAVGLAIFFFNLNFSRARFIGQWILVATGIIAFTSLAGFIYNISGLYTISTFKGMAAHTAVAFLLVFASMLLLYPEVGFMRIFTRRGLGSIAARRLMAALLVVFVFEIIVMIGRSSGIYSEVYESLIHLVVISGVFIFLIFFSFSSLDQLAQVEQTVEHLKEIDKAKTEFVSLASHQLRTPLTSISWFSEMLLKNDVGPLNLKQEEYLGEINAGNRRMIDLVDDLLNASRIDMGTLLIEPKQVDLQETVQSVLLELHPLIEEKKLVMHKEFDENLPKAELDPELSRIIFQNLLSNSVKYTPVGGHIFLRLKKDGAFVDIEVEDTGYGIQKSQQQKVFTKMFRADNIRDKVTDGTGLGLYIVKAVVEQSGGKIRFESPPRKPAQAVGKDMEDKAGTIFFVVLPLKSKHHDGA